MGLNETRNVGKAESMHESSDVVEADESDSNQWPKHPFRSTRSIMPTRYRNDYVIN